MATKHLIAAGIVIVSALCVSDLVQHSSSPYGPRSATRTDELGPSTMGGAQRAELEEDAGSREAMHVASAAAPGKWTAA